MAFTAGARRSGPARQQAFKDFFDFFEEGYRERALKPLPPNILYALVVGPIIALINSNCPGDRLLSAALERDAMRARWDALRFQDES